MRCLLAAATVLALLSGAASASPKWHQLDGYTFERYSEDFGRNYQGEEFDLRRNLFNKELIEVQKHNADKSQTYKRGVNQFSDWSADEKKNYNRFKSRKHELPKGAVSEMVRQNSTTPLPKEVDYRTWTAPRVLSGVKNQGACGGCWGFSATETLESHFALLTGQLPVLSVQQIISCTPSPMLGCGGGDYFYGWMYLQSTTGENEEWLYPFTDFFVKNETKSATAACKNITKEFLPNFPWYPKAGVGSDMYQVTPNDAGALMEALALKGPQSIAVAAQPWMGYEGGIFQNNNSAQGEWSIDHAVQAVGYGHDFDMDMDYWIVRNSWGTSWGEDGFIRLARPAKEPCGMMEGNLVCGTSGLLFQPGYPAVKQLKKKNV